MPKAQRSLESVTQGLGPVRALVLVTSGTETGKARPTMQR